MEFGTLQQTTIQTLADTFNNAFADYELPMQFSTEALANKIRVEDIDLSLSVAAFDNGQPVGFILFGMDDVNGISTAWDGGTGVIPGYRGQKLTYQMFEHILPALKERGAKKILLEVLKNNTTAHGIYERLGFRQVRELIAYNGHVNTKAAAQQYEVQELKNSDKNTLSQLADWTPAWQQMNKRVSNWGDAVTTYTITDNGEIVAYAHYNNHTKRVLQFAVAKNNRLKKIGSALFKHIAGDDAISVVNVDGGCDKSNSFLRAIGLQSFISQYEMEMSM